LTAEANVIELISTSLHHYQCNLSQTLRKYADGDIISVQKGFITLTTEANVLNSFQQNYAPIIVTSVKLLGNMLMGMLLVPNFL
jgi:hypothetical protein